MSPLRSENDVKATRPASVFASVKVYSTSSGVAIRLITSPVGRSTTVMPLPSDPRMRTESVPARKLNQIPGPSDRGD